MEVSIYAYCGPWSLRIDETDGTEEIVGPATASGRLEPVESWAFASQ